MARPTIFESYSQVLPPAGPEMLPVSKPAVFGLLLSILQCLPVISGLGALILGILGLQEVRRKQRIGKPIALAAIAIGAISTLLWIGALGVGAYSFARYSGIYETAERFTRAAAEGRFEAARDLAGPEVSNETLALWLSQVHVENAQPRVETISLDFDESQGVGYDQIWDGPFILVDRVEYLDANGGSAGPTRRARVRVELIEGRPRVVGFEASPWTRVPPVPGVRFDEP